MIARRSRQISTKSPGASCGAASPILEAAWRSVARSDSSLRRREGLSFGARCPRSVAVRRRTTSAAWRSVSFMRESLWNAWSATRWNHSRRASWRFNSSYWFLQSPSRSTATPSPLTGMASRANVAAREPRPAKNRLCSLRKRCFMFIPMAAVRAALVGDSACLAPGMGLRTHVPGWGGYGKPGCRVKTCAHLAQRLGTRVAP